METTTEKYRPNRLASRSPLDTAIILLMIGTTLLIIWLSFTNRSSWSAHWPSYSDMVSSLSEPSAWLRWVLGDISEVAFYKHEFASIGLLAGAYLAYWANRTEKSWQGFAISYGTGLWPWLVTSSLLGLLLSNLLWGWTVKLATHICGICLIASGDGADVWRRLEGHDQRSNHGRRVRHPDVFADR